MGKKVIFPED